MITVYFLVFFFFLILVVLRLIVIIKLDIYIDRCKTISLLVFLTIHKRGMINDKRSG